MAGVGTDIRRLFFTLQAHSLSNGSGCKFWFGPLLPGKEISRQARYYRFLHRFHKYTYFMSSASRKGLPCCEIYQSLRSWHKELNISPGKRCGRHLFAQPDQASMPSQSKNENVHVKLLHWPAAPHIHEELNRSGTTTPTPIVGWL